MIRNVIKTLWGVVMYRQPCIRIGVDNVPNMWTSLWNIQYCSISIGYPGILGLFIDI